MNLFASLFPLIIWLIYSYAGNFLDKLRPSLSNLMNLQRRRWVANAVHRDNPIDAILSSSLMSSVSFFASTTVLLILALFAVFGQIETLHNALSNIRPDLTSADISYHLIVLLGVFIMAFLSFTLSLRQFNHFCILLGAADHAELSNENEVNAIASLNTLGARNFNQGIRAYYFSVAMLIWFLSPLISIGTTIFIVLFLIYRDYFSRARNLISTLTSK